MFELFRGVVGIAIPAFVVSTMLNVGLTQKPSDLLTCLRNRRFVLKMVAANFVFAPLLMILILRVTAFAPPVDAALLIFSLGAGAPFLIKLTEAADHDLALGAATMLLLVLLTVVYLPLALPRLLGGMPVDATAVASTLLRQMILPIALGMVLAKFVSGPAGAVQPWVAGIGTVALYVVIGATFVGYFPTLSSIVGRGVLLAGLIFIAGAFGIGYAAGSGDDHLEDVGALGTAQRNTAAALIVAAQNFDDPRILVVITLISTLGIVMLLAFARVLRRDNPQHRPPPEPRQT